jgi:tetratricopeptide (TPR) repeat protein
LKRVLVVASILTLSACATVSQQPEDGGFAKAFETAERSVNDLLGEQKHAEAATVLQRVAAQYPLRVEPWVRLASLHFESGDYGHAIVAAEEALRRDPSSQHAMSIRAVAGLRVATSSLVDLRAQAPLSGSTRADAARLAIVLRGTLGEEVLVPEAAPALKREVRRSASATAGRTQKGRTVPEAPARVPATATRAAVPVVDGDPFSVLK